MAQTYTEESTLRKLVSASAIGDLTARFNRAYETGERAAWLSTFLPEGSLERAGGEVVSGHAALGRLFGTLTHGAVLVTTDPQIEVEGVHVRQDCRFLVLETATNGSDVVVKVAGRFRDELVHERGGWYFAKRSCVVDLPRASSNGKVV